MATKLSRREFQRNVGALTLAGTGVASAGTPAAETERLSLPPLFYNNDGSFLFFPAPPRTPEDFVYEAVGRFVGTQIGAVVCHMFGFGDAVPLFPTRVPEARGIDRDSFLHVSEWKQQTCIRGLLDQGIDPWQLSLERAHEAGLQYWIGMRFNDLHGPRFQWPSHFRVAHREYELGADCGSGVHGPESVYGREMRGAQLRHSPGPGAPARVGGGRVHPLRRGRLRVGPLARTGTLLPRHRTGKAGPDRVSPGGQGPARPHRSRSGPAPGIRDPGPGDAGEMP